MEMHVARGRTVGDHRHRQAGGVRRVVEDLDVEHGGEATQALRAYAQRIDLFEELQAQFLDAVRWPARDQFVDVDRRHQRLLGQQHGLFRRAADA
jgi:hypothetical protein